MTTRSDPRFDTAEIDAWFALDTPEDFDPDPFEVWTVGPEPGTAFDEEYDLACIARYERAVAAVQGEQVIAIAAFVETYVSDYEVSYRAAEPGFAERSAYAEIALALGIAERTSDARVATACELVERLPATVAAMRAGQVTLPRARVLLEETVHLNSEQRLVVEETLLPKAPALTPGNLRRSTRRLVEKIDAEALLKRTAAAKADRWVRWWELPDGMAELCAQLPAQDAAAIFGVIDELAHAAQAPGDARSIEQIRADAFVDAILRPADLPERVRYAVNVTVPAHVLVGATGIDTVEQAAACLTGTDPDSELAEPSLPTPPGGACSPTRPTDTSWTPTPNGTDPQKGSPKTSGPETSAADSPAADNLATAPTSITPSRPRTGDQRSVGT